MLFILSPFQLLIAHVPRGESRHFVNKPKENEIHKCVCLLSCAEHIHGERGRD
jgi:transglutaminase/protease-like cytokinesis protein 3